MHNIEMIEVLVVFLLVIITLQALVYVCVRLLDMWGKRYNEWMSGKIILSNIY